MGPQLERTCTGVLSLPLAGSPECTLTLGSCTLGPPVRMFPPPPPPGSYNEFERFPSTRLLQPARMLPPFPPQAPTTRLRRTSLLLLPVGMLPAFLSIRLQQPVPMLPPPPSNRLLQRGGGVPLLLPRLPRVPAAERAAARRPARARVAGVRGAHAGEGYVLSLQLGGQWLLLLVRRPCCARAAGVRGAHAGGC